MSQPCHRVSLPEKPFEICMRCTNPLPLHASYVWTPDWYKDFQCGWACHPGYAGAQCESAVPRGLWPLVLVAALALALAALALCRQRRAVVAVVEEPEPLVMRQQMVQFRDDVVHQQIRVKIL